MVITTLVAGPYFWSTLSEGLLIVAEALIEIDFQRSKCSKLDRDCGVQLLGIFIDTSH